MTRLELDFITSTLEGKFIEIDTTIDGIPNTQIGIDFVAQRLGKFQSTAPNLEDQDVIAQNFANAFNIDYSLYGVASSSANRVTITFSNPSLQVVSVGGNTIDDGDITEVIFNNPIQDTPTVVLDGFSADPSNVCGLCFADVSVTGGTEIYNVYRKGYTSKLQDGVTSPLQISAIRGSSEAFRITDSNDDFIGEISFTSPKRIGTKNLDFTVTNSLNNSSTITVNPPFVDNSILPYEYSLDGVVYQSSNIFTDLTPATYTVYIKDAFGCVSSKEIVVDGFTTIVDTIFSISDINAIRFARIDSNKKNHTNTLSCNELKSLNRTYFQKYLESDIITTQFKTNAQYINVRAVDSDMNFNTLPVVQATENTGLTKKSTCTYFDIGDGKSAVYFGEVDILDPLNDTVIETVDYGFTLPEWANKVGQLVEVDGLGVLEIDKIGYSETYSSFILEFNVSFTGTTQTKILSNYNLQPYEIYEFSFAMSLLPNLFQVVIEVGSSASNIEYSLISEKIKRVNDTDSLFDISYYDVENKGGMVYQTGIKHKLRLEGIVDYKGEQDTEGYDGDTNFFVTDNSVYNSQTFTFFRLSSEMVHKLRLVTAHSNLMINGISYKLSEAPDVKTNPNNNSKTFTATFKTGGEQFLTDEQEVINIGNEANKESGEIAAAIEASKGKALVLYTKTNG